MWLKYPPFFLLLHPVKIARIAVLVPFDGVLSLVMRGGAS